MNMHEEYREKVKLEYNDMPELDTFQEEQRFGQWWLWLIIGGSAAAVVIPFIIQLFTGNPVGDNPAPTLVLALISVLMIGLLYMFSSLRLKTYIDQHIIKYDYGILGKREIQWSEVERADVVNYGFVGYGKRISLKHGWVYNVDGKYGLFLTLKDGKKITIGTQNKEELEDFLGRIGRGLG